MFAAKLWLPVILLVVAGAFLLVSGTSILADRVLPPYEQMASNAARGAGGALVEESQRTLEAAARLSAHPAVRTALKDGKPVELSDEVKAAVLAPVEGRFGAPAFAVLAKADGAVVARLGVDTAALGDQLGGHPLFSEAVTGIARDGLITLAGKPFHGAAHPVYDGASPLGVVILGFAYEEAFLAKLSGELNGPVSLLVKDQQLGAAPEGVADEQLRQIVGEGTAGALSLDVPMGLPILLPNKDRWLVQNLPLYPGDKSATLVVAIDRSGAFSALGMAQLAVIVLVGLLGILFAVIIGSTLRSISKPMQTIMDHLSQFQQGSAVGILPESALAGPFVRLGKQINMILQMMPSAARPGGAPLSTLGGAGIGMGAATAAPPVSPATAGQPAKTTDNGLNLESLLGPSGAASGEGAAVPPPPSSPGLPGFGPPSAPTPATGRAAATGSQPSVSSGLSGLFDDGAADPLAAFRVPSSGPGSSSGPVSPSSPLGGAPAGAGQMGAGQMGAGQMGAGQMGAGPADPNAGRAAPMTAEATVMFQVPQELIERSTQDRSMEAALGGGAAGAKKPSSQPPVPQPPPQAMQPPRGPMMDDHRTVVAQVPQELLSQAAPRSDLAPADEAHYREVFTKFVDTRQECGEDISDLTYDRFVQKLLKNRQQIIEKHKARSVRFQVYVKDGKAALRALPVRD